MQQYQGWIQGPVSLYNVAITSSAGCNVHHVSGPEISAFGGGVGGGKDTSKRTV